jgi:hypothetical protein
MRFYDLDGIEMDVQDPKFFMDEEDLHDNEEVIRNSQLGSYGKNEDMDRLK